MNTVLQTPCVGGVLATGVVLASLWGATACGGDAEPWPDASLTEQDVSLDGLIGAGAPNACGGFGVLRLDGFGATPGAPCGVCRDGLVACGSDRALTCLGASQPDACGGCGDSTIAIGDACGACGSSWGCEGTALACQGPGANVCGGCAVLDSDLSAPGTACDSPEGPGVMRCRTPDALVCSPFALNSCGGTGALEAVAGSFCGACFKGSWTCSGPESVTCQGENAGVNDCGGCAPLEGTPGAACGACAGTWSCDADGEGVTCSSPLPNPCGGCTPLSGPLGSACGDGGQIVCDGQGQGGCGDTSDNLCGGVGPLDADPGTACGPCADGLRVCVSLDATACVGQSTLNACLSCGVLAGVPGEPCAEEATWVCLGGDLVCNSPTVTNACGGTVVFGAGDEGPPPQYGEPCGTCSAGIWACDGPDALFCSGGDPDLFWAWPDKDEDDFGDAAVAPQLQCVLESGFARRGGDCNDDAAIQAPGTPEFCDGLDNDCDGITDEAELLLLQYPVLWYADADGDGFGDPADVVAGCIPLDDAAAPPGRVLNNEDCDDADSGAYPWAPEVVADGVDSNCDGFELCYYDGDLDGFPGNHPLVPSPEMTCEPLLVLVPDGEGGVMVDEAQSLRTTSGVAACDNTCTVTQFLDDDVGDMVTYEPNGCESACLDCNDSDAAIHPGALELCGTPQDDDCDGVANDEGAQGCTFFYLDMDSDDFGDPAQEPRCLCAVDLNGVLFAPPDAGFWTADVAGDCDDTDPDRNPGATEVCDGVDNTCDGLVDPSTAVGAVTWYQDLDRDGYGTVPLGKSCTPPVNPAGCEFAPCCQPTPHPGCAANLNIQDCVCWFNAPDCCTNAWSQACVDTAKADCSALMACPATVPDETTCESWVAFVDGDCNDYDGGVHPGGWEWCDYVDNDCDGLTDLGSGVMWYLDTDGDLCGDPNDAAPVDGCRVVRSLGVPFTVSSLAGRTPNNNDCDDTDASIHPLKCMNWTGPNVHVDEVVADGVDQDCDGLEACWVDMDGDGFPTESASIELSADLSCPWDGVTQFMTPNPWGMFDCDDTDPNISPVASNIGETDVDLNCDGLPPQMCAAALRLDVGNDVNGTTVGSTNNLSTEQCGGTLWGETSGEAIIGFVAPTTGTFQFLVVSAFDHVLYVKSGCDQGSACLHVENANSPGPEGFIMDLEQYDLLYLVVDGVAGGEGNYQVVVAPFP